MSVESDRTDMRERSNSIAERDTAILTALTCRVSLRVICIVFGIDALTVRRVAESAGQAMRAEGLGPNVTISQRDAEIVRRALGGEDFSVTGRSIRLSKEGVRLIVKAKTGLTAKDLKEARVSAKQMVREQMVRDIASAEPDANLTDLAARSGFTVHEVRVLLGPAESARRRPSRTIVDTTNREQVLQSLRAVASLPGGTPLSGPFYDKYRGEGVKSQRIIQLFETWSAACRAAGVPSVPAVRSQYEQHWSREDCLQWVARYAATTDAPTFRGLGVWLKTRQGAPSSGTVRLRCGLWIETLREAHTLHVAQQDEIGTSPGVVEDEQSPVDHRPVPTSSPTVTAPSVQGRQPDVDRRVAVENAAQDRLMEHFRNLGWAVEDTRIGRPYDAVASKAGERLYLEAKGTESGGAAVLVTSGEVAHAREHSGRCVIGIWSGIRFDEFGRVEANVGDFRVLPFDPQQDDLKVVTYEWRTATQTDVPSAEWAHAGGSALA